MKWIAAGLVLISISISIFIFYRGKQVEVALVSNLDQPLKETPSHKIRDEAEGSSSSSKISGSIGSELSSTKPQLTSVTDDIHSQYAVATPIFVA